MSKVLAPVTDHLLSHIAPFPPIELVCRTDSLAALRSAVDHGAHSVRLIYRPRKSAHAGAHAESQLSFQRAGLKKAVRYANARGCTVGMEIDASDANAEDMRAVLWRAHDAGICDFTVASLSLALYLRVHLPLVDVRFLANDYHLNRRAVEMLRLQTGLARIVLPRVVSLRLLQLVGAAPGIELEMHGEGPGCVLLLPTHEGVGRLGKAADFRSEFHGDYCAADEKACNETSFNAAHSCGSQALSMLADLHRAGVRGLIIEAPTRSPARVAQQVASWREAIDDQVPTSPALWCRLVPNRA